MVAEAVVVGNVDGAVYVAVDPVLVQVDLYGAVADLDLDDLVASLPQEVYRNLDAGEGVRRVLEREGLPPVEADVADGAALDLVLHFAGVAHVDYVTLLVALERTHAGGEAGQQEPPLDRVVGDVAHLLLQLVDLRGYCLGLSRAERAVAGVDGELAYAVRDVHHLVEGDVGVGQPGHGVVLVADVLGVLQQGSLEGELPRDVDRVVRRARVLLPGGKLVLILQQP